MEMDDYETGFVTGLVAGFTAVIVTAVLIWHVSESDCQKKYDVADCEWGRSPFVPATQEVEND